MQGASEAQIAWGDNVRASCLRAFIEQALRQGGPSALWGRHWWTQELADQISEIEQLLTHELGPMLEKRTLAAEWLNAAPRAKMDNPDVIVRMLKETK